MRYPNTAPVDPSDAFAQRIKLLEQQVAELQRGGAASQWHTVGAAGEPAFENSWTNYGGGWQTVRFRRVRGLCTVQGLVAGGTVGANVFTLPVGYRVTAGHLLWGTYSAGGAGRIDVYTTGALVINTGHATYTSINCQFSVT